MPSKVDLLRYLLAMNSRYVSPGSSEGYHSRLNDPIRKNKQKLSSLSIP